MAIGCILSDYVESAMSSATFELRWPSPSLAGLLGSWASGRIAKSVPGSVGGLVGLVNGGRVAASYSAMDISGASDAGGLVFGFRERTDGAHRLAHAGAVGSLECGRV